MTNKEHIGSTFDSFLEEEGIKDECEQNAKLALIQDFVWKKCGSPTFGNGHVIDEPIEIGLAHVLAYASRNISHLRVTDDSRLIISSHLLEEDLAIDLLGQNEELKLPDQFPETQLAIAKLLGWEW